MKPMDIEFAFCPKCGSNEIGRHGERSVLCPQCGFLYFFNAASAVAAVIATDQGLLLTIRAHDPRKGALDLPGGFVEPGETGEESLRREIREELGIELGSIRYFASFPNKYTYAGIVYSTLDLAYECTSDELDRIRAADDVESHLFVPFDRIDYDQISFESTRNIIRAFVQVRDRR